jgi:hypothetical protein
MHAKTEFSAHFNPRLSLCFSPGLKMLSLSGSVLQWGSVVLFAGSLSDYKNSLAKSKIV